MGKDISELINKVYKDNLSNVLSQYRFTINGFGQWRNVKKTKLTNHMIANFKVAVIRKGEVLLTINNKTRLAQEGDIFFLPPFTIYSVETIENIEYYHQYIHFDILPIFLAMEFAQVIDDEQYVYHLRDDLLFLLLDKAEQEMENHAVGIEALINIGLQYILRMILKQSSQERYNMVEYNHSNDSAHFEMIKSSIKYIDKHIEKTIKIEELAKHLNISQSMLYKCFLSTVKMAPSQFIVKYKIKLAEQLLKTEQYSIKEIANMLGFNTPFHFSNVFKKYKGISPTHFVKCFGKENRA